MKKNLSTLLLTAVGMTLGAAAAYGQTPLKANVPFQFRTSNSSLDAGEYVIKPGTKGSEQVIQITNLRSNHSTFVLANQRVNDDSGKPRLVFRCGNTSGCSLVEAYAGDGHGWKLTSPRSRTDEKEQLATVLLRSLDAE